MDAVLDPAAGSLLRSKLMTPQASADYLPRPQVQAVLAAHPHARLLLFSAPAGFGKTTALALLAEQRRAAGSAVAWFSLGKEDDNPSRFFQQLIKTLGAAVPGLGTHASGFLQNTMQVPVAAVLESLLVELTGLEGPLLLVLDDLHLLSDAEIFGALGRLVKMAPAHFTLAIGSRSLPPMNLATLRAKGWLLEIGLDELRLTEEETRHYLDRSGLALDEATLAALHSQTEGWLIGVHLASLWLRHQPQASDQVLVMGGDQAAVGDYLLITVFEQLPADLQDALLALGIASQLSGDLANALTGRNDGQALLERLETMQLFLLPLDRERQWYRFHHLFADFLRARLQSQDPERFRQLHFNASLWFTNHHMQNLAIEHACLAEDPEMLAALVDGCGLELINRGQLNQIYRWRQFVPDDIAERYPTLILADVWNRATELALPEANQMLDELLARWGGAGVQAPLSDKYLAALAVKAAIALQKDDLDLCVNLARKVEGLLGQHEAFLEVAMLVIGALALVILAQPEQARRLLALAQQRNHFLEGRYLDMQLGNVEILLSLEQGQVKQAQLLHEQMRAQLMPLFGEKSRALALPVIIESLIAYQQGRLDGLEERLRWALNHVDVIKPIDIYAQGMLFLARIQRMQDKPKEALASLVLMQNLAARNQSWRFYVQAVADEVTLILQEPATDRIKRAELRLKAVDWAKLAADYAKRGFNPVLWTQGLIRVRLQQARGHYSEALHEINQLRAQLQPGWHGLQRLRLDLLAALSYQRLGYQERAQSLLVQCLLSAEREDVRSLFVEEGDAIRLLLQQLEAAERQPALQGFIRSLLAIWPGQDIRKSQDVLEEGLTDREREVVLLAAKGLSNEEIGQQLSLALGTVKWHLHNIYEKLKVRNRTQAIRRARELGLLES
ncbi:MULTISPECIES: LuxR C-terminal-related transcriptional regulator [unclassified Pseudomonas]|uniref:LuxR C-terminal-related transcriptional regulator n=1 Tax=unclassified Pseudomonas TaxID=196821 RepID=UPI0021151DB9|nr:MULTISPECIES: LuxR C-terminal-related transcriptional regulator [unclassified Pseudomonas]MDW3714949.1 LuxR C-terminal-related transcriptional regulator [Pseudomonas sp. 2023EL-01195]